MCELRGNMKLETIKVKNFRLLNDICLTLEDKTTLIVGRNNSGKTSLTQLFEYFFSSSTPKFSLEDFTLSVHDDFWSAFLLSTQKSSNLEEIRNKLPNIEMDLHFSYGSTNDLSPLSKFIIDLDENCKTAIISVKYELSDGKINSFFDGFSDEQESEETDRQDKLNFFATLKERIPKYYTVAVQAIDPTDKSNTKKVDLKSVVELLQIGFVGAQRRLDDATHKEKNVLGKVLEKVLTAATLESAGQDDKEIADNLKLAVENIQDEIHSSFNLELDKLLPALGFFGYPGLSDSPLKTETILDVEKLLENHTRILYPGSNGIGLPETYNGLGSRNLIYILFQLFEFYKSFQSSPRLPGLQIVFIEEPEAHLHPQMQEVFIKKLNEVKKIFEEHLGGISWPVQFIVTTHSSHIANATNFESIRYFLSSQSPSAQTKIKDLGEKFNDESLENDKQFLQKYLTLTRCDLFFCDIALLIEGPTERILMPKIISLTESDPGNNCNISSQYLSVIEVGGAYAHRFFELLTFLELKTLVITDIDSTKKKGNRYVKCKVSEGTHTSNITLKKWFGEEDLSIKDLLSKDGQDKVSDLIRIAYQVPEDDPKAKSPCGRSFEDSFMIANQGLFDIEGTSSYEKEDNAWNKVDKIGKTDFALKYALQETNWIVPRYIKEGLSWLSVRKSQE